MKLLKMKKRVSTKLSIKISPRLAQKWLHSLLFQENVIPIPSFCHIRCPHSPYEQITLTDLLNCIASVKLWKLESRNATKYKSKPSHTRHEWTSLSDAGCTINRTIKNFGGKNSTNRKNRHAQNRRNNILFTVEPAFKNTPVRLERSGLLQVMLTFIPWCQVWSGEPSGHNGQLRQQYLLPARSDPAKMSFWMVFQAMP